MKWHRTWQCLAALQHADLYRLRHCGGQAWDPILGGRTDLEMITACFRYLPVWKRRELTSKAILLAIAHQQERCEQILKQHE